MIGLVIPILLEPLLGDELSHSTKYALISLFLLIIGYISSQYQKIWAVIQNMFYYFFKKEEGYVLEIENNLHMDGKVSDTGYSQKFISAIYDRLCNEGKLNKASTNVIPLRSRDLYRENSLGSYYKSYQITPTFMDNSSVVIDSDLSMKTKMEQIVHDHKLIIKQKIIIISKTSLSNCINFARDAYTNWIESMYADEKNTDDNTQYYYSIRFVNRENYPIINWNQAPYTSHMTFDKLFFNHKEDIIKQIDRFTQGKNNKLSYLLYGIPGCGKTSFIKCIANYTKRHIFDINLNRIDTNIELRDIFFHEFFKYSNGGSNDLEKLIPLNKRIIVLEDIDVLNDVVKRRKNDDNWTDDTSIDSTESDNSSSSEKETNIDYKGKILLEMMKGDAKNISSKYQDDKLTLSGLLNIFDGIMELNGPIVIVTTNCPEKLDPALIRHGRITRRIYFGKLGKTEFKQMISNIYPEALDDPMFDTISEKNDLVWAPNDLHAKLENIDSWDKVKSSLNEIL